MRGFVGGAPRSRGLLAGLALCSRFQQKYPCPAPRDGDFCFCDHLIFFVQQFAPIAIGAARDLNKMVPIPHRGMGIFVFVTI